MRGAGFRALSAARRTAWALAAPALRLRHRGAPVVHHRALPQAAPRDAEGYVGRAWAPTGEPRSFHLRSPHARNRLVVERYAGFDAVADAPRFEAVADEPFGRCQPPLPAAAESAEARGCDWPATLTLDTDGWPQGTYRATVVADGLSPDAVADSAITFLVGPAAPTARVAVLAPVTTWAAYNPWGGRSLYHNEVGDGPVHVVHARRPNPALGWDGVGAMHAMAAEAPAHHWIDDAVGADLYPDWMLEHPERLSGYDAVVLAYHCEYATDAMRAGLDEVLGGGASLLALGGNQLYWRVWWHRDHTRLECRKDGTRDEQGRRGGLWRRRGRPEDEALGIRFSPPGTGTYAPYRVADAGHWLFRGLDLADGDLFGERGTTPLPICGDETDAPTWLTRGTAEVIARGLNRADAVDGDYTLWQPRDPAWDGAAGGTIALTTLSPTQAVLATGAIHSPSGLGVDDVFSHVVRRFLERYVGD